MKLKYNAKTEINGKRACDCLNFNWLAINESCKIDNEIQGKCVMLKGCECPKYREGSY